MFLNLSDMYSSSNFFNIYQRDYEESGLLTFIPLLLTYRYLTVIFPSSQRVDTHALGTKSKTKFPLKSVSTLSRETCPCNHTLTCEQ